REAERGHLRAVSACRDDPTALSRTHRRPALEACIRRGGWDRGDGAASFEARIDILFGQLPPWKGHALSGHSGSEVMIAVLEEQRERLNAECALPLPYDFPMQPHSRPSRIPMALPHRMRTVFLRRPPWPRSPSIVAERCGWPARFARADWCGRGRRP